MKGTAPSNKPQLVIYCHNLGKFDGLFLVKSLLNNNSYKLIPTFKDNTLLSLDIVYHLKKEMIIEGVDGGKKKKLRPEW